MSNDKKIKIVIAEDDFLICEDIVRLLRRRGYDIVGEAPNGQEAIELVCNNRPDVVLMDMQMPGIDGLEAARQIQKCCPTPVVILSAYEGSDLVAEAGEAGVGAYLTKPAQETEIERAITIAMMRHDDLMKQRRLASELEREMKGREKAEQERRLLQDRIHHAERLESLRVLAGGVAHDFNNLLTSVMGNTELALSILGPSSEARQFLEQVDEAAARMAELSIQMLSYSGCGTVTIERIDLNQVVSETETLLRESVTEDVELRLMLEGTPYPVRIDPSEISQVIVRLVANASEAMEDLGGVLTLSTGLIDADHEYLAQTYIDDGLAEGCYVFLDVTDTGHGMSEEVLAKAFDPFFSTRFPGRGLGLAAVLGIVRGHRGAITISSDSEHGTTVRVLLPYLDRDTGAHEALRSSARDSSLAGCIMVVDSERWVRKVAQSMLEHLGYRVLTANEGDEAVKLYREGSGDIACVLLDFSMTRLDGERILRRLRRVSNEVRVVLCGSDTKQQIAQRIKELNVAAYITRPYHLEELKETIAAVLAGEGNQR